MEVQPQLVLLQKTLLYAEGVGRQLYPQLDLWKTAKPFLVPDQRSAGIPALTAALKEKSAVLGRKMPEIPELVYDTVCAMGKYLQHSVDKIARELQVNHVRRKVSLVIYWNCYATLLAGHFTVNRPEWGF